MDETISKTEYLREKSRDEAREDALWALAVIPDTVEGDIVLLFEAIRQHENGMVKA